MHLRFVRSLHRLALAGLVLLAPLAVTAQQRTGPVSPSAVPVLPDRKASTLAPEGPPALPPGTEALPPLTLSIRVTDAGGNVVQERTVSRTADRVHIETSSGEEWLFVRNPRDPRRVLGYLVDRAGQAIVVHDESELRNGQQIRGWLDVLTLGFDPRALETMRASGEQAEREGLAFARFRAEGPSGLEEVWWSQSQLLALRITSNRRDGRVVSLEGIRHGVNAERLRSPHERFPAYRVVDLADWLEDR